MNKTKLKKYKDQLLEARAEILRELEVEKEYFVYNEQGDMVDIADSAIQNEVLNRLSDMEVDTLRQIDAALEKIEDGSYGVCEGTGKLIPEARLNHVPWTPYSVEYAAQMEKQRRQAAG